MNRIAEEKSKQMGLFNGTSHQNNKSELWELIHTWEKEDNP